MKEIEEHRTEVEKGTAYDAGPFLVGKRIPESGREIGIRQPLPFSIELMDDPSAAPSQCADTPAGKQAQNAQQGRCRQKDQQGGSS
jgi:hypothetical protein